MGLIDREVSLSFRFVNDKLRPFAGRFHQSDSFFILLTACNSSTHIAEAGETAINEGGDE